MLPKVKLKKNCFLFKWYFIILKPTLCNWIKAEINDMFLERKPKVPIRHYCSSRSVGAFRNQNKNTYKLLVNETIIK